MDTTRKESDGIRLIRVEAGGILANAERITPEREKRIKIVREKKIVIIYYNSVSNTILARKLFAPNEILSEPSNAI